MAARFSSLYIVNSCENIPTQHARLLIFSTAIGTGINVTYSAPYELNTMPMLLILFLVEFYRTARESGA